jgi:transposase
MPGTIAQSVGVDIAKDTLEAHLHPAGTRTARRCSSVRPERVLHRSLAADPALQDRFEILVSIPGVGDATAFAMLVEMPERGALEHKCAASLAGLAPPGFRPAPRQALHPRRTRSSASGPLHAGPGRVRFDAAMKARYQALRAAGKPPKVALVAIMRKLLILANALLRDARTWSPKLA